MIEVKWSKIKETAQIPRFAHDGDAGFDLAAAEDAVIYPFQKKLVGTGLKVELPGGCELQIRPRSGVSLKTGLCIANSPGTIDSTYRGEVGIIVYHGPVLHYHGLWSFIAAFLRALRTPLVIKKGDRIAQGVISSLPAPTFTEIAEEEMAATTRGSGGFGSTGCPLWHQ
ncbi:MAG: dUTP diphosphatase [Alphaproteobacteria bacterium]|uniref:dUTP diphosphatase n=1 Tax=Candidatus Nitrobium versatile TaxID=2884831 RepID=A0A953M2Z4_9BACT|nr:dUTP diphosphatase [Candidatus Nitrobium versatile]